MFTSKRTIRSIGIPYRAATPSSVASRSASGAISWPQGLQQINITSGGKAMGFYAGTRIEMVRTEGADKRSTARFLAFGVNGLSVALMIVVFASTAGVTGTEAGIAGGSAVLGQKLLEAVFGDGAAPADRVVAQPGHTDGPLRRGRLRRGRLGLLGLRLRRGLPRLGRGRGLTLRNPLIS